MTQRSPAEATDVDAKLAFEVELERLGRNSPPGTLRPTWAAIDEKRRTKWRAVIVERARVALEKSNDV